MAMGNQNIPSHRTPQNQTNPMKLHQLHRQAPSPMAMRGWLRSIPALSPLGNFASFSAKALHLSRLPVRGAGYARENRHLPGFLRGEGECEGLKGLSLISALVPPTSAYDSYCLAAWQAMQAGIAGSRSCGADARVGGWVVHVLLKG